MLIEKPAYTNRKNRSLRAESLMVRFRSHTPDPRCELYYETPYQLLVSVVLSAQTTDKMVNRCMEALHKQGFDIETALELGPEGILERIKSIGLAPTKSKNVFKLSQQLRDRHNDEVPGTRDELEALPGVGRKTANVILGEIFRHPTMAVDTHVYRVGRRLGLHRCPTPEKAEIELLKVVDPKWLPDGHHWFILHGRYVCTARKPMCEQCPVNDLCPSWVPS